MGKLMRVSDYLLLTAAIGADTIQDINRVFGIMPEVFKNRYGFVPVNYKKSSYTVTVSKMLSTGDIDKKIDNNGKPYFELTSKGHEKFKRKFPLFSKDRNNWDKYFMVVIFDIPEVQRKDRYMLRLKLEALGFAMLQESVWISPYHFEEDLREFFVNSGLSSKVIVMKAKSIYAGDIHETVRRIWKLEELNNNYLEIIERCRKLSILESAEKNKEAKNIMDLYLQNIKKDPFLPKEIDILENSRRDAGIAIKSLQN